MRHPDRDRWFKLTVLLNLPLMFMWGLLLSAVDMNQALRRQRMAMAIAWLILTFGLATYADWRANKRG